MKNPDKCVSFWAFSSKGKVVGVPCGKWSCEICRKQNAALWAWRARIQIERSDKKYFVWTLTLGSKYTSPKLGYASLPKLWDNLRKTIQRIMNRATGRTFKWSYLAFVEAQPKQRKMPHFHIITSMSYKQFKDARNTIILKDKSKRKHKKLYRLKDFAVHVGFGFEAYEDEITSSGAAHYVSKYVSKGDPSMPKNFRRVRASTGWAKLPEYEGDKLIVRARNETISHYVFRVADQTGHDIDYIYAQWVFANDTDIDIDT